MDESHPQAEAGVAYRVFVLVMIMVSVFGVVLSMIPECGLAGVLMCITVLMLMLFVETGRTL